MTLTGSVYSGHPRPPALKAKSAPDRTKFIPMSEFIMSGAVGFPEIVGPIYDEINEMYGTDYEPEFKE